MPSHDQEMHLDDYGAGPAVVLLHGLPSGPDDFAPLVDALSPRHRVLVAHFPGYGRTPRGTGPYSLDDVVARLERALVSRDVPRADVVAFSGGAYKAVALALAGRITVTRVVLLAPMVGFDPEVAQQYRDLVAALRSGTFDPRPTWLARMTSPGFAERDPAGAARVLGWLDAAPLSVLCDELAASADARDMRPRLGAIACPVLVCAGSKDQAIPPVGAQAMAQAVPRGRFESIEGAGHALLVEAPRAVVHLIGDFLA